MSKRSGEKRDFMQIAREVVEQAMGEKMDGTPLPEKPADTRNPHAVALGRSGGKKGGKVRAQRLTPERRRAIAQKAAKSRWSK